MINNIIRLAGKNRYETSYEIAKYIDLNLYDIENVFITNGYAEADAMSIASISGRYNMPIILTDKEYLNSNIHNWLKNESLNNAYVIGGTDVISDKLMNKINTITKVDIVKNRLGGKDRYYTNALVIERFYGNEIDELYIAKGLELVDALSAGVISSLNNGAIVLSNKDLSTPQKNILSLKNVNFIIEVGGGISRDIINYLKSIFK